MKRLVCILVSCVLFSLSSFACATNTSTQKRYDDIVQKFDEIMPLFGFDKRDFLGGSVNSGVMWYSYNKSFELTLLFDKETLLADRVDIKCKFEDIDIFSAALAATIVLTTFVTGEPVENVQSDFVYIADRLYYHDRQYIYGEYLVRVNCTFINQNSCYVSIVPNDGSYEEPKITYTTSWNYNELARYPEYHLGERISVRGKIESIVGSPSDGYTIILDPTNGRNYFYVYLSPFHMPSYKLLVGDNVTFKSIFAGDISYKTVIGSTNTLPFLNVEEVILH